MPKIVDTSKLIGERHGRLTIESVNRHESRISGTMVVNVVCDCGTRKAITLCNFRHGTRSCGCIRRDWNAKNGHFLEYNGERHTCSEWARILDININTIRSRLSKGLPVEDVLKKERLENSKHSVTSIVGNRYARLVVTGEYTSHGIRMVNARCDCGNEIVTGRYRVMNGMCKSCGCYRADKIRERNAVVKYVIGDEEHTVKEWADKLEITERTFYNKMRRREYKNVTRRVYFGNKLMTNKRIRS